MEQLLGSWSNFEGRASNFLIQRATSYAMEQLHTSSSKFYGDGATLHALEQLHMGSSNFGGDGANPHVIEQIRRRRSNFQVNRAISCMIHGYDM